MVRRALGREVVRGQACIERDLHRWRGNGHEYGHQYESNDHLTVRHQVGQQQQLHFIPDDRPVRDQVDARHVALADDRHADDRHADHCPADDGRSDDDAPDQPSNHHHDDGASDRRGGFLSPQLIIRRR
jgi:hypothetical protein